MFPESKVTEIYCMADDFCKEFTLQQEKYLIEVRWFRCFKHYYKEYVCKHLKHLSLRQVSYNRFVELEKEVLLHLTIFIKKALLETCTGISFVDSLSAIAAYCFFEKKPAIDVNFINDGQLTIF